MHPQRRTPPTLAPAALRRSAASISVPKRVCRLASCPPIATWTRSFTARPSRSRWDRRTLTIDAARNPVVKAAEAFTAGAATPEIQILVARLEKVAGVGIAELGTKKEQHALEGVFEEKSAILRTLTALMVSQRSAVSQQSARGRDG